MEELIVCLFFFCAELLEIRKKFFNFLVSFRLSPCTRKRRNTRTHGNKKKLTSSISVFRGIVFICTKNHEIRVVYSTNILAQSCKISLARLSK